MPQNPPATLSPSGAPAPQGLGAKGIAPNLLPWLERVPPSVALPTGFTGSQPFGKNGTIEAGHNWGELEGAAGSSLSSLQEAGLSERCIKIITNGEGGKGSATLKRQGPFNLAGKAIRMHFKLSADSAEGIKEIAIRVGSGAAAFAAIGKVQLMINTQAIGSGKRKETEQEAYVKPGEDFAVDILPVNLITREGEALNWGALQDFNIRVFDNGEAGKPVPPCTLFFKGMEVIAQSAISAAGVVSFTFDDCYQSQTKAAQVMERFGYKGFAYITVDKLGQKEHLTEAELFNLARVHGWDIGVHCYLGADNFTLTNGHEVATGMTELTEQEFLTDLTNCQRWLKERGYDGLNHLAIPSGRWTPETRLWTQRIMSSARLAGTLIGGVESHPPADLMRLKQIAVTPKTVIGPVGTQGTVLWKLKQVKESGGWVIILVHGIGAEAEEPNVITETAFNEIVEAVNAEGLAVRKITDMLGV